MSRVKKVIVGILVIALVSGAVVGAGLYMRRSNQKEVLVVGVDSLASDYYMQDTSLEGSIATSVSQSVSMDKDMIIQEVYVQKGDTVSKGDKLISFDMTLVEMELKIAKLKKQEQEQDLNKAMNRLNSLQNGGPIEESDGDAGGTADNLNSSDDDLEEDDELASAGTSVGGQYLAAVVRPMLLAAALEEALFDDGSGDVDNSGSGEIQDPEVSTVPSEPEEPEQPEIPEETVTPEQPSPTPGENSGQEDTGNSAGDEFTSGEPYVPEPTPTPVMEEGGIFYDPYTRADEVPGIGDGEETFYQKLDYTSLPYEGTGTEEDPYIFLCSSAKGRVTVMGSFFNVMAGYNEDGSKLLHEGGYWFRLEFHQNDTITNYQDLKESCIGYYLINGGLLDEPVNMYAETEFTLEDADQYEEEDLPPEDDGGDYGDYGDSESTLSRADAIKIQQNKIQTLKLDIQESDINIRKLEKKVSRQMIYSKLDGTVSYVGDPLTGTSDGDAFIRVKSKEGFYVKGSVSELMLDDMKEGTVLNCTSYESGSFEAKVVDVSDYPVDQTDSYYGEGNPNVSYYTYSAEIPDKTLKLEDQDWLNITLQSQVPGSGSIVLEKAFVRSEDGVSYVYKDDNGVLKKQILNVGGNANGGYSVLVKGGITRDDKIAFPYGKNVQEGAKTKEGTLDELYGY